MIYKKGSIVSIEVKSTIPLGLDSTEISVKTISIVSKVVDDKLYCKNSICSVNDGPFKHTREVYPQYEGELKDNIELVNSNDFDIVIDSKLIPKYNFKNIY